MRWYLAAMLTKQTETGWNDVLISPIASLQYACVELHGLTCLKNILELGYLHLLR